MQFNVAAEHVPGKSMVVADALSHSPLPEHASDRELSEEVDAFVHGVEAGFPASKGKLDVIRDASRLDHVLQRVINYTVHGWPQYMDDRLDILNPYWKIVGICLSMKDCYCMALESSYQLT